MFWAGCGADINPLPRRKAALAEAYGKALGEAVIRSLSSVMQDVEPVLETRYVEIPLWFDHLPDEASLKQEAASDNRYAAARARRWLAHLETGQAIPATYPFPIGYWKLGHQVDWLSLGGEVVVDYALRFKKEWGAHWWVAGYSHDVMAYLPSKRVWEEGGYEGGGAMVYYGLPARWSSQVEYQVTQAVEHLVRGTP